jgi:amidase
VRKETVAVLGRLPDEVLCFADAVAQAELIRIGSVTAVQLVEATLDRIGRFDGHLNAFRVVLADQARRDADAVDGGERCGPLAGVPVAIKDDTDVAGEITAWGGEANDAPAVRDADVVARLRAAGAVIIGKTNVPELDVWPWTSSKRWGVTRNPWDTRRTPGGSSGGSAAAVSTGLCTMALGSDGGGSVRYPAALTGIVGYKPQRDSIPLGEQHRDGWNGLLGYGPLTRSVRDSALFIDVTAGSELLDSLARPCPSTRVAVAVNAPPGSLSRLDRARLAAVAEVAQLLQSLGHSVTETRLPMSSALMRNMTIRYLSGVAIDAKSVQHPDTLERRTKRLARFGRMISQRRLAAARAQEAAIAEQLNAVFNEADAVITPVAAGPPPLLSEVDKRGALSSFRASNNGAYAMPWNVIGQPAITVPAGQDADGLPLAVQLCGRAHDNTTVLRLASQIETARPWIAQLPREPRHV